MAGTSGESTAHRHLKYAALAWAQENGFEAAGLEIRLPNSNFRADAAACRFERPAPGECRIGLTAVFECKQARPDFLNDSCPEAGSLSRLAQLKRRREKIEQLVGGHYPHLRLGESLFPEFDRTEVAAIRHDGYRKITAEIRRLESAVFQRTKFDRVARYRCADLCYLVIRPGIIEPDEVPADWGLLAPEDPQFELDDPESPVSRLELLRRPHRLEASDAQRLDLLHRVAAKGTRRLNTEAGIEFDRKSLRSI